MKPRARYIATASIASLVLLGAASTAFAFSGIRRSFSSLIESHQSSEICRSMTEACKTASVFLAGLLETPIQLVYLAPLAFVAGASIKAAFAFRRARRIANEYAFAEVIPGKLDYVLSGLFGDKRPVVRISDSDHPMAFTYGFLRPSICITHGLIRRLTTEELEGVVAHEYAHIRRKDNIALMVGAIAKDSLFVVPLAHFLFGLFVREKEHAADEFAVGLTKKPVELASALVTLSKAKLNDGMVVGVPAFITPAGASVEGRVKQLLSGGMKSEGLGSRLAVSLFTSLLLFGAVTGVALGQPSPESVAKASCHSTVDCSTGESAHVLETNDCKG